MVGCGSERYGVVALVQGMPTRLESLELNRVRAANKSLYSLKNFYQT
jgi:hypothetical protein